VRRFYTDVATGRDGDSFSVLLDARPVRTPARRAVRLPTEPLAAAIAEEWRAQGEEIDAQAMRLTRLATTVIDLMPTRRGDAVAEVSGYAGTDLLCYRTAAPEALAARQATAWQPWLDWAERQYNARLWPAVGVMPAGQDEATLQTLRAAVERLDDWRLVGLHAATTLTGSLVLGLALECGAITAERAFEAAMLDELFEIEQWGEDEEQAARHARLRADLAAAERFLAFLPAG
jgi:chaperone required for assembly of F1-ATPase